MVKNNVETVSSFDIVPLIPSACEISVARRIMVNTLTFCFVFRGVARYKFRLYDGVFGSYFDFVYEYFDKLFQRGDWRHNRNDH